MIRVRFLNGFHDLAVWQRELDAQFPNFIASLPSEVAGKLDYSVDSLDTLKEWWLSVYPRPELIEGKQGRQLLHSMAYYFAKVFMQYCGGHWAIDYDGDEKPDGIPIIINFKYYDRNDRPSLPPFAYVISSLNKRTGRLLSKMARNYCRENLNV